MTTPNRSSALVPIPNRSPEPARRRIGSALQTRSEPVRPPAGLVATARTVPDEPAGRSWRPDLWPWWIWVPVLCLPVALVITTAWLALGLVLA